MKFNKSISLAMLALACISSLSYSLFDRPSEGGRAEGLDIDYTDPRTGETRRRFAPLEAIFGGHDQTSSSNRNYYAPRNRGYNNNDYRNSYNDRADADYGDEYSD